MDMMFACLPKRSVTQYEDITMDSKASFAKATHSPELTNRDIEAEILARLERRGHDWTGKRRSQRSTS